MDLRGSIPNNTAGWDGRKQVHHRDHLVGAWVTVTGISTTTRRSIWLR